MADSGRGIRGHGIRYLAATSDLAGAADPRQIDAQAPAIAAIHAPGSVCSCSGSAVARARLARRGRLSQAVRGGGLRAHGERHRADSAHQRRWLGELLRRADRERAASGSTWSTRWSTLARWARRSSVWSEPPEGRSHGRIDRLYTLARRGGSLGGKLVGADEAVSCRCTVRARRARGGRWRPPGRPSWRSTSSSVGPTRAGTHERPGRGDRRLRHDRSQASG
jgi:hypothetical protein